MESNLFIRKSFNAVALRNAVNEYLDPKIRSIRGDKSLNNTIARAWADEVTRFVPRSNLPIPDEEHLQGYTVSDGRVIWSRKADEDDPNDYFFAGEEIAYMLYDGPIRGTFHSRYSGHQPQAHWDDCVRPGTEAWQTFVDKITPEIIERMRKDG